MTLISFLQEESVVYTLSLMLFIIEWLQFYTKYLFWVLCVHTVLTFITFVFLDVYLQVTPDINQDEKLILIKWLKLVEYSTLLTTMWAFSLLVVESILGLTHEILITLLFCELLHLLVFDLQVIVIKFLLKTCVWVSVYTKIYRFYTSVFFEFKTPMDKVGNFLIKILPIIKLLLLFFVFTLICSLIARPYLVVYL